MYKKLTTYLPMINEMLSLAKDRKKILENENSDNVNREYLTVCNLINKLEGVYVEITNAQNPYYHP